MSFRFRRGLAQPNAIVQARRSPACPEGLAVLTLDKSFSPAFWYQDADYPKPSTRVPFHLISMLIQWFYIQNLHSLSQSHIHTRRWHKGIVFQPAAYNSVSRWRWKRWLLQKENHKSLVWCLWELGYYINFGIFYEIRGHLCRFLLFVNVIWPLIPKKLQGMPPLDDDITYRHFCFRITLK